MVAVITAISTIIRVISGIWLWAREPRERRLGGLCLAAGCLLFVTMAVLLCR